MAKRLEVLPSWSARESIDLSIRRGNCSSGGSSCCSNNKLLCGFSSSLRGGGRGIWQFPRLLQRRVKNCSGPDLCLLYRILRPAARIQATAYGFSLSQRSKYPIFKLYSLVPHIPLRVWLLEPQNTNIGSLDPLGIMELLAKHHTPDVQAAEQKNIQDCFPSSIHSGSKNHTLNGIWDERP